MNELTHKRPATKKDVREFMQMIKMSPQKYLAIHSRLTKLIENGADLNTQGYLGQTLLHVAIKIGDLRLLNMFLDANVNVDLANDFCESPIHKAVIAGKLKFVEALVEHGCDLHAGCEQDQTPLHLAVSGGYVDIVKYLVEKGADPKGTIHQLIMQLMKKIQKSLSILCRVNLLMMKEEKKLTSF